MSFDRIGLGTNNPQTDFHLVGNSIVQGNVTIGLNSAAVNPLRVTSDGNVPTLYATQDGVNGIYAAKFEGTTSVAQGVHIKTIANADSMNSLFIEGQSANVVVKSSGKVGLGTETPTESLHVVGNAKITGILSVGTIAINTYGMGTLSVGQLVVNTLSAGTIVGAAISVPSIFTPNINATVVNASIVSASSGIFSQGPIRVGSTVLDSNTSGTTTLGVNPTNDALNASVVLYGSTYSLGQAGTVEITTTKHPGGEGFFRVNNRNSLGTVTTNFVVRDTGQTGIGTTAIDSNTRLAIQGNVVVSGATAISGTLSVGGMLTVNSSIIGNTLSASSGVFQAISTANIFANNMVSNTISAVNGTLSTLTLDTAIINTASIANLQFNNITVSGQVSSLTIAVNVLSATTAIAINQTISTATIRNMSVSNAGITGNLSVNTLNVISAAVTNGLSVLGNAAVNGNVVVGAGLSIGGGLFVNSTSGTLYDTRRKVISLGPYNGGPSAISWEPYLTETNSRGWRVSADDAGPWGSFTIQSSTTQTGVPSSVRICIDKDGNVGIGSDNPLSRLYVNGNSTVIGNSTVSGNITASNISVTGTIAASNFVGNITTTGSIMDNLSVLVAARINGTLSVGGASTIVGSLSVGGVIRTGSGISVAGNMITNNNISAAGAATFVGSLSVGGIVKTSSNVFTVGSPEILDTRVCAIRTGHGAGISWSATTSQTDSRSWRIANDDVGPWGSFTIASGTTNSNSPGIARLIITKEGYVGIGTNTSSYPLQITSSVSTALGYPNSYVFNNITGTNPAAAWFGGFNYSTIYSIVADAYIFSRVGFSTLSDERIKKDISMIDDGSALQTLRKVEPKKYKYRDPTRGDKEVFGFIAQDVQKEFPEATQTVVGEIPDIYRQCRVELPNKLFLTGLEVNNKLSLWLFDGKRLDVSIINVEEDHVIISEQMKQENLYNGEVFVYGRIVDDLINIKKDYLWAINFAATQELDRQVQQLRQENAELKEKLALIMAKLDM